VCVGGRLLRRWLPGISGRATLLVEAKVEGKGHKIARDAERQGIARGDWKGKQTIHSAGAHRSTRAGATRREKAAAPATSRGYGGASSR